MTAKRKRPHTCSGAKGSLGCRACADGEAEARAAIVDARASKLIASGKVGRISWSVQRGASGRPFVIAGNVPLMIGTLTLGGAELRDAITALRRAERAQRPIVGWVVKLYRRYLKGSVFYGRHKEGSVCFTSSIDCIQVLRSHATVHRTRARAELVRDRYARREWVKRAVLVPVRGDRKP